MVENVARAGDRGLRAGRRFAQDDADLQKQIDELKARAPGHRPRRSRRIKTENAELKARLGRGDVDRSRRRSTGCQDCATPCGTTRPIGCERRSRSAASSASAGTSSLGDSLGSPKAARSGRRAGPEQEHDGHWGDARVRLNFRYDFGCDVTAFAELQSHWALGDDPTGPIDDLNGNDTVGDVHMYQAWLESRNIFGRRELLVAASDARRSSSATSSSSATRTGTTASSSTAAATDWDSELLEPDGPRDEALVASDGDVNQVSSFQTTHDDDELYGAYFTLKPIKCTAIDLYWIYVNGHGGASGQALGEQRRERRLRRQPYLGTPRVPLSGPRPTTRRRRADRRHVQRPVRPRLQRRSRLCRSATSTTDRRRGRRRRRRLFAVEAEVGVTFEQEEPRSACSRAASSPKGPSDDDVGYLILFPNRHSNDGFRARYGLADLIPMTNVESPAGRRPLRSVLQLDVRCDRVVGRRPTSRSVAGLNADYGYELDLWGEWRYSPQVTFGGGIAFVQPDDQGQILWGLEDDPQVIGYLQARLVF